MAINTKHLSFKGQGINLWRLTLGDQNCSLSDLAELTQISVSELQVVAQNLKLTVTDTEVKGSFRRVGGFLQFISYRVNGINIQDVRPISIWFTARMMFKFLMLSGIRVLTPLIGRLILITLPLFVAGWVFGNRLNQVSSLTLTILCILPYVLTRLFSRHRQHKVGI